MDIDDDGKGVYSVNNHPRQHDSNDKITGRNDSSERRSSSSFGSLIFPRNGSSKIMPASQELVSLASLLKQPPPPSLGHSGRSESAAAHALEGLNFISKAGGSHGGWAAVEKRFEALTAGSDGQLNRGQFGECIGKINNPLDSDLRLFDVLARRRNIAGDSINKAELKDFWDQLADQSFDSRLQTFFDMVDKDADGKISVEEVEEIICLSASANKLSNIRDQSDEFAAMIMEEIDDDNSGYITIDELKTLLFKIPHPYARGDSLDPSKLTSEQLKPSPIGIRWMRKTKYLILDHWKRVWVMLLWFCAMAGLFAWKYIQYRNHSPSYKVMGVCVCMAKGAAETLKLNMALILLPVCRNTLTWLRNKTKLGSVVPFDDNIDFHKLIAIAISIGVGIHAISHLACDFPRLISATPDEYEDMVEFFGKQPESYWHFVKSFEGISGIIMVILMAIAFTLASPWFRNYNNSNKKFLPKSLKRLVGFNAFWYSHHLFVVVYVLLVAHGIKLYLTKEWYNKTTWMYLAIPVVAYACERLVRVLRSSVVEPVKILRAVVYPGQVSAPKFPGEGDVLALYMSKPSCFKYKSGEYMFVKCSAVSPFEWHPFSITSAPDDEYLSVHIRTLGDWTGQITTVFSQLCEKRPPGDKSGILRADFFKGENIPKVPKVSLDGPYGAPAQDYKNYEVVLLVGLGIGATPMISIVKDIMNNMKAAEAAEAAYYDALESGGNKHPPPGNGNKNNFFRTRKAYFYWLAREQGSFEWFKEVMNEVAESDEKGVVEMHIHCTSVYEEGDARSALITMLQSLNHAKKRVDVVSGTRVKSHFARPNWPNVYNRIALKHTDTKVGVFYCGAPTLTKQLKHLALDFTQTTSTEFEFHAENF